MDKVNTYFQDQYCLDNNKHKRLQLKPGLQPVLWSVILAKLLCLARLLWCNCRSIGCNICPHDAGGRRVHAESPHNPADCGWDCKPRGWSGASW